MSKRGPGGASLGTRKRRKNGLSTSSSTLDGPGVLSTKRQFMQIWHTNAEDPAAMPRKSEVLLPTEPQIMEDAGAAGENFASIPPEESTAAPRPKRKRGNDSVSHSPNTYKLQY